MKISELAREAAEAECLQRCAGKPGKMPKFAKTGASVQSAINEACKPLVEGLEILASRLGLFVKDHAYDHSVTPCDCQKCYDYRIIMRLLEAHHIAHGPEEKA